MYFFQFVLLALLQSTPTFYPLKSEKTIPCKCFSLNKQLDISYTTCFKHLSKDMHC